MGKPDSILFCRMHDNRATWDGLDDLDKFKIITLSLVGKIKGFADSHSSFSRIDAVYALYAFLDPNKEPQYQKYALKYNNDISNALLDIVNADRELYSIVEAELSASGDMSGLYLFASVWALPIWFGVDIGKEGHDVACIVLDRILQLEENGKDVSQDMDTWMSLAYMCDFEKWHDERYGNSIVGLSLNDKNNIQSSDNEVSTNQKTDNDNDLDGAYAAWSNGRSLESGEIMTVWGINGKAYQLEHKPISSGGEGDIYEVSGKDDIVIKIYHSNRVSPDLEKKIILMAQNPPSVDVLDQVAWPIDVVYDSQKAFCGFAMPKLNITNELSEIYVYPPSKTTSSMAYSYKIIVALNICTVINAVHKAGYIFGDFNPHNIGVNLNTGHVAFLDTDSYHIVLDEGANKAYRCTVCLDGYVAPELLKKCESYKKDAYAVAPLPTFTKETDNFALAIHIFKLLMNGYTPFNGIKETDSVSSSSPGIGNQAIKRDSYCFKPGNKPQAVAVPPLEVLPEDIVELFTRAFMYGRMDPKQRPSANEWYDALDRYYSSLEKCPRRNIHMYKKGLSTCPWCEADERYRSVFFSQPNQKTFPMPVIPDLTAPNTAQTPVHNSQPTVSTIQTTTTLSNSQGSIINGGTNRVFVKKRKNANFARSFSNLEKVCLIVLILINVAYIPFLISSNLFFSFIRDYTAFSVTIWIFPICFFLIMRNFWYRIGTSIIPWFLSCMVSSISSVLMWLGCIFIKFGSNFETVVFVGIPYLVVALAAILFVWYTNENFGKGYYRYMFILFFIMCFGIAYYDYSIGKMGVGAVGLEIQLFAAAPAVISVCFSCVKTISKIVGH